MIRTRFAPSPTGFLHVGGLRTALYSYLVAKQAGLPRRSGAEAGGKFLLRIEDTDQARSVEGAVENMLSTLRWAGIEPDEKPTIQSERLEIYQAHAQKLLDAGHAYYCFCTKEDLEKMRAEQEAKKLPPLYNRRCLKLTPDEVKEQLAKKQPQVIRLKMPSTGETIFTDIIRGEVRFKNELLDDQVIIKSDGFPTYHLAVVVDDHEMQITHVIRGEEWVSSTPKHIQLYKYFGWELPLFAHLPLILNPDKSKLSKRQGDVSVEFYRDKGYLPEAIVNFIAFLGWNPGTDKEIYSPAELITDFSLAKVSKSGAVFNIEKLNWYNQQYLKLLPLPELVERTMPWFEKNGLRTTDYGLPFFEKALALERERVTTLAELPEAVKFVFELPEYPAELLIWKKSTMDEIKKILPNLKNFLSTFSETDWNKTSLEQKIGGWITEKLHTTGSVLWPLRVTLSGQQNSPGPYEIAEVLGKVESLRRLDIAITKISS